MSTRQGSRCRGRGRSQTNVLEGNKRGNNINKKNQQHRHIQKSDHRNDNYFCRQGYEN